MGIEAASGNLPVRRPVGNFPSLNQGVKKPNLLGSSSLCCQAVAGNDRIPVPPTTHVSHFPLRPILYVETDRFFFFPSFILLHSNRSNNTGTCTPESSIWF